MAELVHLDKHTRYFDKQKGLIALAGLGTLILRIMSRFSLRALFVGVALVALAIVATMNANRPWAVAMEVLVYLLLSTAIVGALWTIGERRAFWGGCGYSDGRYGWPGQCPHTSNCRERNGGKR